MNIRPTLVGHIGTVSGAAVSVRQSPNVASGIAIIGGQSYRIGQVGSFVRIPQGYHDLYGIVVEVGANATPEAYRQIQDRGERWMSVQLVGEIAGTDFERGISQYPNLNDEVHLVTEQDLATIYGITETNRISIGRFANADGIPVTIDLDKLVTRHSAVVGSTGSGKSTTVASILRSIAGSSMADMPFPAARILLLDIHGEYAQALRQVAKVFRVNPNQGENQLYVPYWALDTSDFLDFLMGRLDEKATTQILERIQAAKSTAASRETFMGTDITSLTSDTPIPYSLRQLWFDLMDPEIKTWQDNGKTVRAIEEEGDPNTLTPPKYRPASTGNTPPYLNQIGVLGIRRQLDQLRSRLLDRRYDFLLHPGPWEPDLTGRAKMDLPELLSSWLGHERPITILDLSGIPSAILDRLIGAILRIIFDSLVWAREKSEGGTRRPVLLVLEEAHRYLGVDSDGAARRMVQRVVKEGRKFGIGAMIVSQRPSEVDETVLSQCGTFIALRLSNSADRSRIQATLPDNLAGIAEMLPILRTGEAIIAGEAARLPIRCRITLPPDDERPNSEDPAVSANWSRQRITEDYGRAVASWRSQNPRWSERRVERTPIAQAEKTDMEREPVASSNIRSIGYDEASSMLEVEFNSGFVYQYYNVPPITYEQMMQSESKTKFLTAYVKPIYPFSRV